MFTIASAAVFCVAASFQVWSWRYPFENFAPVDHQGFDFDGQEEDAEMLDAFAVSDVEDDVSPSSMEVDNSLPKKEMTKIINVVTDEVDFLSLEDPLDVLEQWVANDNVVQAQLSKDQSHFDSASTTSIDKPLHNLGRRDGSFGPKKKRTTPYPINLKFGGVIPPLLLQQKLQTILEAEEPIEDALRASPNLVTISRPASSTALSHPALEHHLCNTNISKSIDENDDVVDEDKKENIVPKTTTNSTKNTKSTPKSDKGPNKHVLKRRAPLSPVDSNIPLQSTSLKRTRVEDGFEDSNKKSKATIDTPRIVACPTRRHNRLRR